MFYTQFLASIRWNTLEAIIYQALLVANQALLFSILDPKQYGMIGMLFSLLYLTVMATNGGLDISLGPLFTAWSKNKSTTRRILLPHLLVQPCIITLLIIALMIARLSLTAYIPHLASLSPGVLLTLGLLAQSESIKKTMRALLHLIFLSRVTALVEIATIISYVGSIVILYYAGWPLTVLSIFLPLLIVSWIGVVILGIVLYRWYAALPEEQASFDPTLNRRMIKSRLWNYGIQLGHALFSGNFLISLFGIQFGLAQAGIAKFANSIAHGIATLVRKIFDTTSGSYLSNMKDHDTQTKHAAFIIISTHINQLLYSIILGMCIIAPRLWKLNTAANMHTSMLIILLCAVHIFELFYIAYEKFYINEEKSSYLLMSYAIPAVILFVVYVLSPSLSMYAILIALLIARIITFLILSLLSIMLWNLRPSLHAQPKYLAYTAFASLTILFFIS